MAQVVQLQQSQTHKKNNMYQLKDNELAIEPIKGQLKQNGEVVEYNIVIFENTKYNNITKTASLVPILATLVESEFECYITNHYGLAEVVLPAEVVANWNYDDKVLYDYVISKYESIKLIKNI